TGRAPRGGTTGADGLRAGRARRRRSSGSSWAQARMRKRNVSVLLRSPNVLFLCHTCDNSLDNAAAAVARPAGSSGSEPRRPESYSGPGVPADDIDDGVGRPAGAEVEDADVA